MDSICFSPCGGREFAEHTLFISHEEAGNPPAQDSKLFASRGREAGVDIGLERTEGGLHGFSQNPLGVKHSRFEFFRGKQRIAGPRKIEANSDVQRLGVGRGPIEDAFGAPVLVVEGTSGTPAQHQVDMTL
jgi:hypothetical protein